MGGFNDDFDENEEDVELEGEEKEGPDDEFSLDEDDEKKSSGGKKNKSEGTGFNRENYYCYKDKLVQLSGTIRPHERSKEGKVLSIEFKTEDKIYQVIMDEMGKKLMGFCYQELLVTGLVSKITEKEYTIAIKTYI